MSQTLVAYFSRRGNNYVAGSIINLEVGNTEKMAKIIQATLACDSYEIEVKQPYPEDYHICTELAADEKKENKRPALKNERVDLTPYHTIYLGFPNWWQTAPMAVFTFLESHDFTRKTIVPFCTHEGSGFGNSLADVERACQPATIKDGLALFGGEVDNKKQEILDWIDRSESK